MHVLPAYDSFSQLEKFSIEVWQYKPGKDNSANILTPPPSPCPVELCLSQLSVTINVELTASKNCPRLCEPTKSCNFGRSLAAHYGVRGCCWTSCQSRSLKFLEAITWRSYFSHKPAPPSRWCAESKTRSKSRIIYFMVAPVWEKKRVLSIRMWSSLDGPCPVGRVCVDGWAGELTVKVPREEESVRYRRCEGKSKPGR